MKRLRELRKSKSLTMKQLGNMIGLSESTISLYENGKHEPDHATLASLAKCLDTSIDYLLGNSDNPAVIRNQPTAEGDELDAELISLLCSLSPSEEQRVRDFVAGLIAARGDAASQPR